MPVPDASSAHRARRFTSKRDPWLVFLLWGASLGLVYAGIDVAGSPASTAFKALFILGCVLGATLVLWLLYGTFYILTDEALLIRCGPFRQRIPVSTIQEVTPSRSPVSGAACSLDRLHIKHTGSGSVLISPADKRSFLRALAGLDPELAQRGDAITRST